MKVDHVTLISDASWCPFTKAGGWAVWLVINIGGVVTRVKRHGQFKELPESPEEAEIWSLRNGLHLARKHPVKVILAQSDCQGALRILREEQPDVVFKHVKGHTNVEDARSWVNRWCDEKAKAHMVKRRKQIEAERRNPKKHASTKNNG